MLTAKRVRELLSYDLETGIFKWRMRVSSRANAGDVAGCINGNGYLQIGICGRLYPAHRLAWLYVYGRWPKNEIDHLNGIKLDNRFLNFREVAHAINRQNQRLANVDSKTGILGVQPSGNRFIARITVGTKRVYLGTFDTSAQAHEAYIAAKRRLHPGCTI